MIVLAQLGADHPNRRTSDQTGARGHGYAVTLRCLGSERAVVAGRGVTVQSAERANRAFEVADLARRQNMSLIPHDPVNDRVTDIRGFVLVVASSRHNLNLS